MSIDTALTRYLSSLVYNLLEYFTQLLAIGLRMSKTKNFIRKGIPIDIVYNIANHYFIWKTLKQHPSGLSMGLKKFRIHHYIKFSFCSEETCAWSCPTIFHHTICQCIQPGSGNPSLPGGQGFHGDKRER